MKSLVKKTEIYYWIVVLLALEKEKISFPRNACFEKMQKLAKCVHIAWCMHDAVLLLPSVPRCCQKKWNAKSLQKWLKINLQYGKLPTFQSQELLWNYWYRKNNKNYYTNTTKAISYTVSKDKQTSCQDCHFLTFNKSRSPTFPPESLVLLSFLCRLLLQPTPHRWFWKLFMSIAKKS